MEVSIAVLTEEAALLAASAPTLVDTERAISFSYVVPLQAVRLPSGPTLVE
jgi:hypothetical protein